MNLKAASLLCALLLWTTLAGCPANDLSGSDTITGGTTPSNHDSGNADSGGADTGTDAGDTDAGNQDDGGATDDGGASGGGNADDQNDGADTGSDDGATGDTGNNNAGDDGADDTGTGETPDLSAFTGSFAGQLACTKTESVQGGAGPTEEWNANLTITFGADGYPTALTVPAYMQDAHDMLEFSVPVAQAGDHVSVTQTTGTYTATLTATVTEATYTATTGHVVLTLEHHGAQDALVEDGTGTFTVDYTLSGDQLTYTAVVAYDVTLINVISLDTTWGLTSTGTLQRQ